MMTHSAETAARAARRHRAAARSRARRAREETVAELLEIFAVDLRARRRREAMKQLLQPDEVAALRRIDAEMQQAFQQQFPSPR